MTDNIWNEYIKTVKRIKSSRKKISAAKQNRILNEIIFTNNFYKPRINTIDLHGLTQDQAFIALKEFLQNAYETRKRQVTIITGKGRPDKPSIMKLEVPRWLTHTELNNLVSKIDTSLEERESGKILVTLKKYRDI